MCEHVMARNRWSKYSSCTRHHDASREARQFFMSAVGKGCVHVRRKGEAELVKLAHQRPNHGDSTAHT
jgi:hypothetical protein